MDLAKTTARRDEKHLSHFLNQRWLIYWRIYASHILNELRTYFNEISIETQKFSVNKIHLKCHQQNVSPFVQVSFYQFYLFSGKKRSTKNFGRKHQLMFLKISTCLPHKLTTRGKTRSHIQPQHSLISCNFSQKYSDNTLRSLPMRASYGLAFVSSKSDLYHLLLKMSVT